MKKVNVAQLVTEIKTAARGIIGKDLASLKGFSERQLAAIGQQAALVAQGIISGQIREDTREFFLDSIVQMTENFLETLQGLFWLTVEKLWNSIVGAIWKALNSTITAATGLVLDTPSKV